LLTLAIRPYIISQVSKWAWTHVHKWFQQQSLSYKPQTTYQCPNNVYNCDFIIRLFMQQFMNLDFLFRSYCFVFHVATINTTPWQLATCWVKTHYRGANFGTFMTCIKSIYLQNVLHLILGFIFCVWGLYFHFQKVKII
jgi:hypothetical protein